MKRLNHNIFFKAKDYLKGETDQTYELLHYVGEQLPECFDSEDLEDVLSSIVSTSILYLHRFPLKWMQDNPKLMLEKLKLVPNMLENASEDKELAKSFQQACYKALKMKS